MIRFSFWRDRFLYLVLIVACAAVILAYQFRYPFAIDVGGQIDRPLLSWVHDSQVDGELTYRWTTGGSEVILRDWGAGNPVQLRVRVTRWRPHDRIAELVLYVNGLEFAEPPAQGQGWQEYTLDITDRRLLSSDDLNIKFETDTFIPKQDMPGQSDDPRKLGVQLDFIRILPLVNENGQWRAVNGIAFMPFQVPPTHFAFYFLLSIFFSYLTLTQFKIPRVYAFAGLALLSVALSVALVVVRPYITLFAETFFTISLGGIALAFVARGVAPRLFAWGGVHADEGEVNVLALMFGLAFVSKLAFLLYPQTISFDLWYHVHRLQDVLRGVLFWSIPSGKNEFGGQPVPYLPSYYLFLTPFAALNQGDEFFLRLVVQISAVILDSLTIFFVYYWLKKYFDSGRAGLFAAWVYLVVPLAFIAISWGIYANIFGQFLTLGLVTALLESYDHLPNTRGMVVATLLFALTMLSHTSVFVSIAPMLAVWVGLLLLFGLMGRARPCVVLSTFASLSVNSVKNPTSIQGDSLRRRSGEAWSHNTPLRMTAVLIACILVAAIVAYGVYYSEFVGLVTQGTQQLAETTAESPTGTTTGEALTVWELLQPARTEFIAVPLYIYALAVAGFAWMIYQTRQSFTSERFLFVTILAAWFVAFALLMYVRAEFGFSSRYVNYVMPAVALCAGAACAWVYERLGELLESPFVGRLGAIGVMILLTAQGAYHWFVLVMFKYH